MLLNQSALNTVVLNGGPSDVVPPHSGAPGGRFISNADLAFLLTSPGIVYYARVKIPDANGIVRDYSNRDAIDWLHSLEYSGDIDAPIGTATVRLHREVGGRSLSPLRTNSSYNPPAGPSIDGGRNILIDVAALPLGTEPSDITDDDWHTVFDGFIDSVDWTATPIVLDCRDRGALLQDVWFKSTNVVPDTGANIQTALETLIAALYPDITDTLWVPQPPDPVVIVGAFRYDIEPGLDALVRVAQIIGWDLRYRYSDEDHRFRLCFRDPGRGKTTPDFTIGASNYFDVKQMKIDRTGVRNDVTIWFGAADARDKITVSDAVSIARYGRRSMVIQEASDSPIKTADDARKMAILILADIDGPLADKQIEMPYFWPIELQDLVRFSANLVHSDTDLNLAVTGYKHTLSLTESRTVLTTRGQPAGSYWNWLARGGPATEPDTANPGPDFFANLKQTPDYAGNNIVLTWSFFLGGMTYEVFVEENQGLGFFSQGTTTFATWTYHTTANIEPSGSGEPIVVGFYVKATLGGILVSKSPISWMYYRTP